MHSCFDKFSTNGIEYAGDCVLFLRREVAAAYSPTWKAPSSSQDRQEKLSVDRQRVEQFELGVPGCGLFL